MTMTDATKLTASKDILAYLATQFPACFGVTGAAKPLKIGIFDDLVARLADDPKVSKTRLRSAVRHYTNSWRYLRCLKAGSQRLDLDGQPAGTVEPGHAEHAQQQLAEAKALVAKNKPVTEQQNSDYPAKRPSPRAAKEKPVKRSRPSTPKPSSAPPKRKAVNLTAAVPAALSVGQQVLVKVANNTLSGQITEIDRNDLQVQLHNGLTVKVQYDAVYLKKQES